MLAAERYENIVQLVNEHGSMRVSDLSKRFGVTEETIRRDLDHLQSLGKLRRSHGGAVGIKDEGQPEIPFAEREVMHVAEKKRIAAEAVLHIQENDRIILDASSTAWYMAAILPNIPLTVLTNSIKVAVELSGKEKIEVLSTGGLLTPRSLSYIGPLAERSLDMYHVDKAFISCKGVHLQYGISESNEFQSRLKQKMIELADRAYLLVDFSKFGVRAFAHVAHLADIDVVITDARTDDQTIQELAELEIDVVRLE